ncbi:hypothetical protein ACLMJK_009676 [Lecanora helva]
MPKKSDKVGLGRQRADNRDTLGQSKLKATVQIQEGSGKSSLLFAGADYRGSPSVTIQAIGWAKETAEWFELQPGDVVELGINLSKSPEHMIRSMYLLERAKNDIDLEDVNSQDDDYLAKRPRFLVYTDNNGERRVFTWWPDSKLPFEFWEKALKSVTKRNILPREVAKMNTDMDLGSQSRAIGRSSSVGPPAQPDIVQPSKPIVDTPAKADMNPSAAQDVTLSPGPHLISSVKQDLNMSPKPVKPKITLPARLKAKFSGKSKSISLRIKQAKSSAMLIGAPPINLKDVMAARANLASSMGPDATPKAKPDGNVPPKSNIDLLAEEFKG